MHALDLAGGTLADGARPSSGPESDGFGIDDGGAAGPLLDDAAKAAYRGRLEELREDLAEAERWNDAERASRAQEEIQALGAELERIGEQNPTLGQHLDTAIRTGTYCSYRPDPQASIDWDLG